MDHDELPENVAIFPGSASDDFDPSVILRAALRTKLTSCVVLGWDENGELFVSCSDAHLPDVNWLLDQGKAFILSQPVEEE